MATRRASKRKRVNHTGSKEEEEENSAKNSRRINKKEEKSPVVVFAHGAGAPSSSDWMIRWKSLLVKTLNAVEVVTFDYPYISGGKRRAPLKAEKLVEFHCDIVTETMAKYPCHPLVLAGKSMGSRVSCMVAREKDVTASAVVCLGYPLKGNNGALRDETLLELAVPVMFVQGSKDGLCPLVLLEAVRKKMNAMNALYVIEGGDHSFKISKKHLQSSGSSQEEAEDQAVQAISEFVSSSLEKRGNQSFGQLTSKKITSFDSAMASMQCHKPCEQKQYSGDSYKCKTTEHHSFTDKMKGMTDKLFHLNKDQHGSSVAKTGCAPISHPSLDAKTGCAPCNGTSMEKKKTMTKKEGHCKPKRNEYKRKNKRDGGCSDGSSSSSESDSDNDKC